MCGSCHTLCLDNKGNVYSWGLNDNGELGREGNPKTPKKIEFTKSVNFIAAGESFSLISELNKS